MLDYRTRTFLTVYRTRSFTAAARELHITQPAVSQHIKYLEAHYGCMLFAKQGHSIEPTLQAQALYPHLLAMANDEGKMMEELASLSSGEHAGAPLHLGCTRTVADYLAPRLIAGYLLNHPARALTMKTGNTRDLLDDIAHGELDVALVEGSFDRTGYEHEALSREDYIAVATPALANSIHGIDDLLLHPLILREPGSGTREILEASLAARDLRVDDFARTYELESIPVIKTCVRAGIGVSFLYRIAVQDELSKGTLVDVTPSDYTLQHDFNLVWQRGSIMAARYRALLAEWRTELTSDTDFGLHFTRL